MKVQQISALFVVGSLAVLFAYGCGGADNTPAGGTFTPIDNGDTATGGDIAANDDAAVADAGTPQDAGTVDAGPTDAGPQDTGPVDSGPVDVGAPEDTGDPNAKPCQFDAFIGATGLECGGGMVCVGNQGQCTGKVQGLCKPKIVQCPEIMAPVCGCDDTTYDNACKAQKEGVTIKHGGKCGGAPTACGGSTGVICPNDFVCDVTTCDNKASGLCVAEPKGSCPPGGIPECGCDNQEYANSCERLKAKVPLKQKGSCPSSGSIACKIGPAGKVLKPCPAGEFCKLNVNNPIPCTGDGVCAIIPKGCDKSLNKVCGCDFQDYDNPCLAAKDQVNIKSFGGCGGSGGGCIEGKKECPPNTYCGVPKGQCGTKGICINLPPQSTCTPDIKQACGCDGQTYPNAGCAATKGVVVKHDGICKGP